MLSCAVGLDSAGECSCRMARMAFGLSENTRAGGSAASRARCDTRTVLELTIH